MIATMNFDVYAATTSLGIIKFIFIISAYLLPYILIPFMIKSLSGVFGNLAGMVNDRSKGLLDRNAKFRQNKRAEKMAAAKGGARFNGRNAFTRGLNRAGAQGYTATGSRPFGTFGQRGKEAREQNAGVYAAQQGKDNSKLQYFMNTNDDGGALLALSGGNTNGLKDAKKELRALWIGQGVDVATADERADAAESAAKAMGVNRSNSMAAWNMMAQNKARSLGAVTDAWETGGILANAADRQGAGNSAQALNARQGFQFNARGSGAMHLGGGNLAESWSKAQMHQIATGTAAQAQAFSEFWSNEHSGALQDIEAAYASGDQGSIDTAHIRLQRARTAKIEMQSSLNYATGDNASALNSAIDRMNVEPASIIPPLPVPTPGVSQSPAYVQAVNDRNEALARLTLVDTEARARARAYTPPSPTSPGQPMGP